MDPGHILRRAEAKDGTVKFCVALADGARRGEPSPWSSGAASRSACRARSGCALACDFCLTARWASPATSTPGEIAGQVAAAAGRPRSSRQPAFNVVFMGMGEPLHNYDGVLARAAACSSTPRASRSRARRITVSTAGLAPAIERLADEPDRPRLAVSLNATTDARARPPHADQQALPDRAPARRLPRASRRPPASASPSSTCCWPASTTATRTCGACLALLRARAGQAQPDPVQRGPRTAPLPAPAPASASWPIRDRLLAARLAGRIRWSRGAEARAACGQLAVLEGESR